MSWERAASMSVNRTCRIGGSKLKAQSVKLKEMVKPKTPITFAMVLGADRQTDAGSRAGRKANLGGRPDWKLGPWSFP